MKNLEISAASGVAVASPQMTELTRHHSLKEVDTHLATELAKLDSFFSGETKESGNDYADVLIRMPFPQSTFLNVSLGCAASSLTTDPVISVYGVEFKKNRVTCVPLLNKNSSFLVTLNTGSSGANLVQISDDEYRLQFDPNQYAFDMRGFPAALIRRTTAAVGSGEVWSDLWCM